MAKRTTAQRRKRRLARVWEAQHRCCMWCWDPLPFAEATLEHIVPLADGGPAERVSNFGAAHWECNQYRAAISIQSKLLAARPRISLVVEMSTLKADPELLERGDDPGDG